MPRPQLTFSTTGKRRRPDAGIYYRSECGEYAVYHSDQICGQPVRESVWLAIWYAVGPQGERDDVGRVLGRRKGRGGAESLCKKHRRSEGRVDRLRLIQKPATTRREASKAARIVNRMVEIVKAEVATATKQGELF